VAHLDLAEIGDTLGVCPLGAAVWQLVDPYLNVGDRCAIRGTHPNAQPPEWALLLDVADGVVVIRYLFDLATGGLVVADPFGSQRRLLAIARIERTLLPVCPEECIGSAIVLVGSVVDSPLP
jgi:hypothetical protein